MPLDIGRFRDSDLVTEEEPDAIIAAILLWGVAWHQVPAASVPNNDRWLAKAAGYGRALDSWLKVKAGALRGFVLCTDGRLYNKTLAEKALAAWDSRRRYEWQKASDRHRKSQRDRPESEKTKFPEFEEWKSIESAKGSTGKRKQFRRNDLGIPPEKPLKGREGKGREGKGYKTLSTERVGESVVDDDSGSGDDGDQASVQPEHFVELWNEIAVRIERPVVTRLSVQRRAVLNDRIAAQTIEDFQTVLDNIEKSSFLRGKTAKWKGVTFDWVIAEENFIKVLEGNYD